jgi:hypothetical protein
MSEARASDSPGRLGATYGLVVETSSGGFAPSRLE